MLHSVKTPEIVTRPDPGLARGVWEASPVALYAGLGVVLAAATLYAAARAGLLARVIARARPKPVEPPRASVRPGAPPSSRRRP